MTFLDKIPSKKDCLEIHHVESHDTGSGAGAGESLSSNILTRSQFSGLRLAHTNTLMAGRVVDGPERKSLNI